MCGKSVYNLGLLFGCDVNNYEENDFELVSFLHKIIHEYIAALYIVDQVEKDLSFLSRTFPTWTHIKKHIEVYRFCCGRGNEQSKSVFVDYFIKTMVDFTSDMMSQGWDRPTHVYTYKGDTYAERELELINHSDTQELMVNLEEILREFKGTGLYSMPLSVNDIFVSNACVSQEDISKFISTRRLLVFDEQTSHHLTALFSKITSTMENENGLRQGLLMNDLAPEKLQLVSEALMTTTNLKYVYLNKFEKLIPEHLKRILVKPIESLYIIHSKVPEDAKDLVDALTRCIHLKVFNLWSTQDITHDILKTVGNMKALTYFSLDGCNLDSEKCQTLCNQLKHLSQLEILEMPYNKISYHAEFLSNAIKYWGSSSKLKRLNLVKCQIPSSVTGDLLKTLSQCCPDLYWLGLTGNDLQDNIENLVKSKSNLRRLYISGTHLSSIDISHLSTRIEEQKLLKLELLDISNNNLSEQSLLTLAGSLNKYHKGEMLLNIGGNNLKEEALRKRVLKSRHKVKIVVDA